MRWATNSLAGQHCLWHLSPKGKLITDTKPRLQWASVPSSADLHVPTGTSPWIVALISALGTLQFTSTNDTVRLLTSRGLLQTLKGSWPQDGWGRAAGCRAGGGGSVAVPIYSIALGPAIQLPQARRKQQQENTSPKSKKGEKYPGHVPSLLPASCLEPSSPSGRVLHRQGHRRLVWSHWWLAAWDG